MQRYMPCIKTSVSEFRALANLNEETLNAILPLFELTKGRKSPSDKEGEVDKNIKKIAEIFEARPFLLDLTRDESNRNSEIESFLMRDNGFENWVNFIRKVQIQCPAVIPVLQSSDESTISDIEYQVRHFSQYCDRIAMRVVPSNYAKFKDAGFKDLIIKTLRTISPNTKLIFVADSENIREKDGKCNIEFFSRAAAECINEISAIASTADIAGFSVFHISSSFPQSINGESAGDSKGGADLYELRLHHQINQMLTDIKARYGDYACIYQFQKPVAAYNWVPRVDYPVSPDTCIYYRYRSKDGGYLKCIDALTSDSRFKKNIIKCWGTNQILASEKTRELSGASPSFWISVRSNVWMTRMSAM